MRYYALLFAALLGMASPAMAQTTTAVNPTTLQFTPSPDQDTLGLDGAPLVAKYEMRMFMVSTGLITPLATFDLGKPAPVNGVITVLNPAWFTGLTKNTVYVAKVAAIGPSGEGVSDPSNPFGMAGPPAGPTAVAVLKK